MNYKNRYAEMAEEYYLNLEWIGVLFWDLNNLKYINDVYGHAAGDKAIETLSAVLLAHSGDNCRVYRIGGDEFLMVPDNPEENEAEGIIQAVRRDLESENGDGGMQISGAAGYAMGKGRDITGSTGGGCLRLWKKWSRSLMRKSVYFPRMAFVCMENGTI